MFRLKISKVPTYAALVACLLTTPFAFNRVYADASSAPEASGMQTTRIVLQHIVPSDILTSLHWDHAGTLPAGVTKITAQPSENALSVVATPAGMALVRVMVSLLDIEPRRVQIKSALATATDAQLAATGIDFFLVPVDAPQSATVSSPEFLQYATGKSVAALLAALAKQGAISEAPSVDTANNVTAQLSCSFTSAQQEQAELHFQVTPRINSDDSITLALNVSVSQNPANTKTSLFSIKTLRTVKNGETMVIGKKTANGSTLLLFVTPTVLLKQ